MNSTLEDLLKKKKHKIDIDAKKWIQKRDEWIERVEKLYKKIHGWLKPFENKELLRIVYTEVHRREEILGDYSIKKMTLVFFNNAEINIEPVGLHIIGGNGRVDMKVGLRTIMIIGKDDAEWMFAERAERGKRTTWDFNKDSFEGILKEFIEEF